MGGNFAVVFFLGKFSRKADKCYKNIDFGLYCIVICLTMNKRILYLFLFIFPLWTAAQNCAIQVSNTVVCLGNAVSFTVTYNAGLTVQSFNWNFGDATVGTVSLNNSHLYLTPGIYTPTLRIVFTNAQTCDISAPTITVFRKPNAKFNLTTPKTQCNKDNQICIKDVSTKGLNSLGIKSRLILWDDGTFINTADLSNADYCHSYTNPFGRKYTIVLEITDSNNCISRVEKTDSVTIYTAMQPVGFNLSSTNKCDTTFANFVNTSQFPQSQAKKIYWDFGDGSIDSSGAKWTNLKHTYAKTGKFIPKLTIVNFDGCSLAVEGSQIKNVKLSNKINISNSSKCYSNINYLFSPDSPDVDVNYTWIVFNQNDNVLETVNGQTYSISNSNKIKFSCGKYKIRLLMSYKACSKSLDTVFDVLGPISKIYDGNKPPQNLNQCNANDTVFVISPNLDGSCYYNNAIKRLWDFGDPFAPACTLDTKNNINIGLNCRYSKDSIQVKHLFNATKDQCYKISLTLSDVNTGCKSLDTVNVSLTPPNAKPGPLETPKRKGLIWTGKACIGSPILYDFTETLPTCSRNATWIKADSADSQGNWQIVDSTKFTFPITYTKITDPKGWVTVGLIIKNGSCYDTAWYHNLINIIEIKPAINVNVLGTCQPYTLKLNARDSIQDSLTQALWYIDGNLISNQLFAKTDSIIKPCSKLVPSQGQYNLSLQLINRKTCVERFDTTINLGFQKSINYSKSILCLGDSIQLLDSINYYDSKVNFWGDTSRASRGKEKMWWQINNSGFVYTGGKPKFLLNKVGNYTVTLVAKDSLNCIDTLVKYEQLKIVDLKASIKNMQQLYVCAPKVALFSDSSYVLDSSAQYGDAPYASIIKKTWNFGDNKDDAFVDEPIHEYTANGKYKAYLAIEADNGCLDTAYMDIELKGPNPSFGILKGDTFGCNPVSITLKNTTGRQIDDWIWTARGPINSVISTQKDTNVTFVFTQAGVYKLRLYGSENVFNPVTGNFQNCVASYPDSLNPNSPEFNVRVVDRPYLSFTAPDTVCVNESFNVVSTLDPVYGSYTLDFGDNNSRFADTSEKTITTSYLKTGSFIIKLIGNTSQKISCIDTPSKTVYVQSVKADFSIDESKNPIFKFNNLSKGATEFNWNFGATQAGNQNTSKDENPSFDYSNYLSSTDSVKICLAVASSRDCKDTICKKIYPFSKGVKIYNVFSPDGDGKNDVLDFDLKGIGKYELFVYNRWGDLVFESSKDGIGNDGNNWNGKVQNTGAECATGTYFYIFKYRFLGQNSDNQERGTITLIR